MNDEWPIVDGDLFIDEDRGYVYMAIREDGRLVAREMKVDRDEGAEIRTDFEKLKRVDP